jgi:hypothetical protein
MGAAVVSGVDAAPIFEPSEHVFGFVALLIEDGVVGDRDLSIGFRGDADGDAALGEGGAELIGVVALVGEKLLGLGHGGQHPLTPRTNKAEMLFAHLKRPLNRLRLRGPKGANDEFLLAATAQNLTWLAKLILLTAPTFAT